MAYIVKKLSSGILRLLCWIAIAFGGAVALAAALMLCFPGVVEERGGLIALLSIGLLALILGNLTDKRAKHWWQTA